MARAEADRNLLFGVLALQTALIDRDALIEAMRAWILDKRKSLGAILADQRALSPENRAVLEPLVEAHLRQHGCDPSRGLAAAGGSARYGRIWSGSTTPTCRPAWQVSAKG